MSSTVRQFAISGRVQGVGFRAATQDKARALGLAGWVRNLADGRVRVLAGGDSDTLDDFEAWLGDGPSAAAVEQVVEETAPGDAELPDPFTVR